MALNWSYENVTPEGKAMIESSWLGEKGDETNPALDSVIWATMAIGVGQWTKANMPAVLERMAIYQFLCGPAITFNDGRRYYVTPEELAKLEGLSTNVTKETDAAFAKKVIRWVKEEAERAMRKTVRPLTERPSGDVMGAFAAQAATKATNA
jgi:hypothetical protein